MSELDVFRVTGTTDVAEIAAVLAAVSSARSQAVSPELSGYERWRRGRLTAMRRT